MGRMGPGRASALVLLAALATACDAKSSTSPSKALSSLAGTVLVAGTQTGLAGAAVDVAAGVNSGRSTTTDSAGKYRLTDLSPGSMTLRASAPGYTFVEQTIVLPAAGTADLVLSPATGFYTSGRVVDAITAAAMAGVAISGTGINALPSQSTGAFSVIAPAGGGGSDPLPLVFSGAGLVERRTYLRVPGPDAIVSVIPGTFDLPAFNEFCRVSQLLRWTTAPPLQIERRTLQFTSVSDTAFTATADTLTDAEANQLRADLEWALPQLTGDHFIGFGGVTVRPSDEGSQVAFLNSDRITVARFAGLTAATGFWGYSRWQFQPDGTIIGGAIMLDSDFERSGSQFRRALRSHELGHALGYSHVMARTSVMNASARLEPNAWDRDAARLAFQRPPGNRSPDTDPDLFSANRLTLFATWSIGSR